VTSLGQKGLFLSHPRNAGPAVPVTNLAGDLVLTGSASVLYRASDGAILVGERSPVNSSVDVHAIWLQGTAVVRDHAFSVGTGGPCCGEIPQMALLPDGRVVVAATDLAAGPLMNYRTTSYGWQGVGTVDTRSGLVTPIAIANGAALTDVFNALALSPDAQTVYLGTYVSNVRGDVWSVPLAGGTAVLVASVPAGISNLGFDNQGFLLVTDAYTQQGLFRLDVTNGQWTQVPHSSGALNGIANEPVTGGFAVVTGGAGTPSRSVLWMERTGADHLLDTPAGIATPSGVAIHLNPARIGAGSPKTNVYDWELAPNPGGLPQPGNQGFSLTLATTGSQRPLFGVFAIALQRLSAPLPLLGVDLWLDPASVVFTGAVPPIPSYAIALPIPNDPTLTGLALVLQTLHQEQDGRLGASPGVQFTVL
jgi:hypothetical protein